MQRQINSVFGLTCLCQEPPRASHLDFGLMKSNLYWAPPACEEETGRQDQRRRKKLLKNTCEEGVGDGKWTDKHEQGSKSNRNKKKRQTWRQHHNCQLKRGRSLISDTRTGLKQTTVISVCLTGLIFAEEVCDGLGQRRHVRQPPSQTCVLTAFSPSRCFSWAAG